MYRNYLAAALTTILVWPAAGQTNHDSLLQRGWFEERTAHFNLYSCGPTQEVAKVGARLEQFRDAYSSLAGAQAVASPPIVVLAFPDRKVMEPFLPLYHGKPANLAAFFHRSSDENLIVLYLAGAGSGSLDSVFHEYTHLLFRHNQLFWPMWLNEGMAEIYSTFTVTSDGGVLVGRPLEHYLRLLAEKPLMPLARLFAVTHDSPDYNERARQGIFYAESWLLAHYLMLGDGPENKTRFSQLTPLLRQGQSPEQAFTNAFRVTLPQMETQLRRYLERGRFEPLKLAVTTDLSAPRALATRGVPPVEVCFRLGDLLLRVGRLDAAQRLFEQGQKIAPKSPLPAEGLGLLAAERGESDEALRRLREAMQRGSTSFLVPYTYARVRYRMTARSGDTYGPVSNQVAEEIQRELQQSLALMPEFGPAHEVLGFFLMVQGENLGLAEQHLQRAIQLEPENQSYLFSLAQLQLRRNNLEAARRTLEPLRLSYADASLRARAEQMLREFSPPPPRRR